jgi:hypothetical protein
MVPPYMILSPPTNLPHSNTTGRNHALEQKKRMFLLFLHATQVNDYSVFFFHFSSFHGGMVWVFTEDKKYPSCARFLLFGLEECMICACMQR